MLSVPKLSRRALRLLLAAALLLAAYTAAGFWLVPKLLVGGVRDTFLERYQRDARLGDVTFNPFSFELVARDFALPDADGSSLLSFERLYVNVGLVSVVRGGLSFQAIALDKPHVRLVRRADGSLNLADFASADEAPSDPNAPPPRLWIDDLVIRDGRTTLVDLDRPKQLSLDFGPITFQVRKFSTRSDGNEYTLAVQAAHGEQLHWRGDFGLSPLASHGKFSLKNLQAQTLAEIAADSAPFQVTGGQLGADGSYAFGGRGKDLQLHVDVSQLLLEALGVRVPGDSSDVVSLPRLTVSNVRVDLDSQTVAVERVLLDQLKVAAVRDAAGQLNLARLQPAAAPPQPAAAASKPWVITLPEIVLQAADITFEDRSVAQPAKFHLAPLDFSVKGYALPSAGPLQLELKTGVNESGQLALQGPLDLSALSGRFQLDASAIPLVPAQPYLDEVVGFTMKSGKASIRGALDVAAAQLVSFEGEASCDELRTADKELDEDFVKWSNLRLTGLNVQLDPLALKIAEIAVTEPYARVVINENGSTNIQHVLAPSAPAAQPVAAGAGAETSVAAATDPAKVAAGPQHATAKPEPTALPIEIDVVNVDSGSVSFADRSIKPHFETGIQMLSGSIKGLSARPDARADVQLAGQVDRYTPVKITGKVNYFAAVSYTDLQLAFRNLELTSFSPYSGRFAGYKIERGKLKVNLNYLVKKRRLNAKHKVVIDQLQLGAAVTSPDATSLPVKLAVALLKDRNGVIDLDIPVSGNLDDPKFKVWPIVWQVVVNLLTKIVTSPFALLGSLFGGGEDISYVELAPASATLSAGAKAKLQTLSKALSERPALNLDLPLVVKPDVDEPALRAQRWQEERERLARKRLGARGQDPTAVSRALATPKDYRAALEAGYREAFGKAPALPQPAPQPTAAGDSKKKSQPPALPDAVAIAWIEDKLEARISVGPSDLEALARERAQQVQSVILDGTGIDPARVFVITSEPLAADTALRMQLALH
jgi:uncharacterized protein involved in outer membrane biogenesis